MYYEDNQVRCTDTREEVEVKEKHLDLYDAVRGIESVNIRLDELLDRIRGAVPRAAVEDVVKQGPPPNLAEVLNGTPGEIRDIVEGMHSRIGELIKVLF